MQGKLRRPQVSVHVTTQQVLNERTAMDQQTKSVHLTPNQSLLKKNVEVIVRVSGVSRHYYCQSISY